MTVEPAWRVADPGLARDPEARRHQLRSIADLVIMRRITFAFALALCVLAIAAMFVWPGDILFFGIGLSWVVRRLFDAFLGRDDQRRGSATACSSSAKEILLQCSQDDRGAWPVAHRDQMPETFENDDGLT